MTVKKSFAELIAEEQERSARTNTCLICTHPERAEIETLLTDKSPDKISMSVIARALGNSGIFGDRSENGIYEHVGKHKRFHIKE